MPSVLRCRIGITREVPICGFHVYEFRETKNPDAAQTQKRGRRHDAPLVNSRCIQAASLLLYVFAADLTDDVTALTKSFFEFGRIFTTASR